MKESNAHIQIFFEECNDTQYSNSITVRKNVTGKLTSIIGNPFDFRIKDSISVNNDRNDDRRNFESIDSNAEFRENL